MTRAARCTSARSITPASSVRMHAFPTRKRWPRTPAGARISRRGDCLGNLSDVCQRITVSRNSQLRRRLSAQPPPLPLPITIPIPSDTLFLTHASTFTTLQDHCHRYSCLQPSQAPGITTINNSNTLLLQPPGSSNSVPETNDNPTQSGIRVFLSISKDPFYLPMSTCVETQTAGLHQLDNMTGLQKHPRTKAAASRYIVFPSRFVFFDFCKTREYHVVRKQCFPFFTQPTSPDSLDTSAFSQVPTPGPQLSQALQRFSFSCCQSRPALPRLYHVICPPVTGFLPKARRNMACYGK